MDQISSIMNFNENENLPIIDNQEVNSNSILNESAENKLSALDPNACFQSNLETDKQILSGVNNNSQNEDPNRSFTPTEYSTSGISNNSEEKNSSLTSEGGTTKADSNVSLTLVSNSEANDNLSANVSSGEMPVGSINFLPEDFSAKICSDNQNNLINNATESNESSVSEAVNISSFSICGEELKNETKNSLVAHDLVDFSFRDQRSIINDLVGIGADSVSKHPESLNSTLENTSDIISADNKKENIPLSISTKLCDSDSAIKVPEESLTNIDENSMTADTAENKTLLLEESININSPLNVSGNHPVLNNTVTGNTSLELEKTTKVADNIYLEHENSTKVSDNISLDFEKLTKVSDNTSIELEKPTNNVSNASIELEKPTNNVSNTSIELEKPTKIAEDVTKVILADKVCSDETAFQMSGNESNEFSPLKIENVSLGVSDKSFGQFSDPDFLCEIPSKEANEISSLKEEKFSIDSSDKPLEQFSNPDLVLNPPCEFSPLKEEKDSVNMSDLGQFSSSDLEGPNIEQDKFSPLKAGKLSFGMSDNSLEQFSDFAFKVPEVPSINPLGQCENPDFAFKMPDKPLTNESDEQFVDAVQFFRDPNSLQFLENIRTSTVKSESAVPRSSLYVNFDPLHSKIQSISPRADNCDLISAALQENNATLKSNSEVVNKQLVDVSARESLGNILISFDSPKATTCTDSKVPAQTPSPPKMISEEELQQKLKIHELETQDVYLKKQREMETEIAKRDELLKCQQIVIEEFCGISFKLSEESIKNREKIISLDKEIEKLKEDLKTSAEDLQSVENTFTDFYKRYDQCKGMLKTYKDNEEHLKQQILDLQGKAKEQEQMYNMLQERTEEMLEKANMEMDSVKQSGEAQEIVLKAKLKKAEMKISSLESDIKQIKEENSQLGGICDDLMAKVSRS